MTLPAGFTLRDGGPDDLDALAAIERRADRLYLTTGLVGMVEGRDPPVEPLRRQLRDGHVLVIDASGAGPVGFAAAELVDSALHLAQLSVDPDRQRLGLGRALVDAVVDLARASFAPAVTLTTFRDVPWNGPFYRSLGFLPLDERLAPGLAAIRASEQARGIDAIAPRCAMAKPL